MQFCVILLFKVIINILLRSIKLFLDFDKIFIILIYHVLWKKFEINALSLKVLLLSKVLLLTCYRVEVIEFTENFFELIVHQISDLVKHLRFLLYSNSQITKSSILIKYFYKKHNFTYQAILISTIIF